MQYSLIDSFHDGLIKVGKNKEVKIKINDKNGLNELMMNKFEFFGCFYTKILKLKQ